MKHVTIYTSYHAKSLTVSHFNASFLNSRYYSVYKCRHFLDSPPIVIMDSSSSTLNEEPATVEQGSPQALWDLSAIWNTVEQCSPQVPWDGYVDIAKMEAESKRKRLQEAENAARRSKVSTIPCTVFSMGEEMIIEVHTRRSGAEDARPIFQHLQAHLRASVEILGKYSDEEFETPYLAPLFAADTVATPRTKQIAADQILFCYHHNAVSETLRDLSEGCCNQFGLPCNGNWRIARNYFSHGVLMPYQPIWWASTMQRIKKLHPELLTQVEKTYRAIEERLSDDEAWSDPEEKVEAEKDADVELAWSPVEPHAPENENSDEYGNGDEEFDDEDLSDEVFEVWDTTSHSGDRIDLTQDDVTSDSGDLIDFTQDEET